MNQEGKLSEWSKSLGAFGEETAAYGQGIKALGAQTLGMDETRDEALSDYQHNMEASRSGWLAPKVDRIEDIKNWSDLGDWAAYQIPKGLGTVLTSLGGGMAGVGAKVASKAAIKKLAKTGVQEIATDLAAKTAARKGLARAAMAGAGATTFGMEGGHLYGGLANDPEVGPEKAVGPAVVGGLLNAGLEIGPEYLGAKLLGLDSWIKTGVRKTIKETPELAKKAKLLVKAAKGAGVGVAVEGTTEGLQELVQIAAERWAKDDPMFAKLDAEQQSAVLNSIVAGGFIGGLVGGAAGPFANTTQAPGSDQTDQILKTFGEVKPTEGYVGSTKEEASDALFSGWPFQSTSQEVGGKNITKKFYFSEDGQFIKKVLTDPDGKTLTIYERESVPEVQDELRVQGETREDESVVPETQRAPAAAAEPTIEEPVGTEEGAVESEGTQESAADLERRAQFFDKLAQDEEALGEFADQEKLKRLRYSAEVIRAGWDIQEAPPTIIEPEVADAVQDPEASQVYEDVSGAEPVGGQEVQVPVEEGSEGVRQEGQEGIEEPATITNIEDIADVIQARRQKHLQRFKELQYQGKTPTISKAGLHAPSGGWVDPNSGKEYAPGEFVPLSEDERDAFAALYGEQIRKTSEKKAKFKVLAKDQDKLQELLGGSVGFGKEFVGDDGQSRVMAYVSGTSGTVNKLEQLAPKTQRSLLSKAEADADGIKLGKTWKFPSLKRAVLAMNNKAAAAMGSRGSGYSYDKMLKDGFTHEQILQQLQEEYPGLKPEYFGKEVGYTYSDNTLKFREARQEAGQEEQAVATQPAEKVVETLRKRDGTTFDSAASAQRELNRRWNAGKLQIEKGKEAGRQARARVAQEGDGWVIEKLESHATVTQASPIDFVADSDRILGQGWTQRAIDAGLLKLNETSAADAPSASYDTGTGITELNLDKVPANQGVAGVVAHELGSHAGMAQMLGQAQFNDFVGDLRKLADAGSTTAREALKDSVRGLVAVAPADSELGKIRQQLQASGLTPKEESDLLTKARDLLQESQAWALAEEDMAYYVQRATNETPQEVGFWNRLRRAIEAWFAGTKFGQGLLKLGWSPEMSPQLATSLARAGARSVVQQAEAGQKLVAREERRLEKLPAGVRGEVLASSGEVLKSRMWRSGVEDAIEAAPQAKMAPAQWKGWLKKQPGVKQEEMNDLGFEDWLDAQEGTVTRDQVLGFVRDGGVRIEEKVLGEETTEDTKFATYQLPGGENYRELLITVPRPTAENWSIKYTDGSSDTKYGEYPTQEAAQAALVESGETDIAVPIRNDFVKSEDEYRSSHFSEPNILVHLRFNERTDADGKRVLFVEEVQSDWHQKGRKEGYALTNQEEQQLAKLVTEDDPNVEDEQILNLLDRKRKGVPDAPFKSSWPLLGMKRAIRWAAENGFDSVAWKRDPQDLKSSGGWNELEQRGDQWFANGDQNVTSIVNRYTRDIPNKLAQYGKKFGAKVGTTEINTLDYREDVPFDERVSSTAQFQNQQTEVWSLPITPALRDEALTGQLLYSFPRVRDMGKPETWFTNPVSTTVASRNRPGYFNELFHNLVDAFHYAKAWSPETYRALDEHRNIMGAAHELVKREFFQPMLRLVRRWNPRDAELAPFRRMGLEEPSVTDLAGHQLAARHVILDGQIEGSKNVNEFLALKLAPKVLDELRPHLDAATQKQLDAEIAAILKNSQKLTRGQAQQLLEKYSNGVLSASAQELVNEWQLVRRRGSGYSTATDPAARAEDEKAGFLNAHELFAAAQQNPLFAELGKLSDELALYQLETLKGEPDRGVLSEKQVDAARRAYAHYVPLRREDFDYDAAMQAALESPRKGMMHLIRREGSAVHPSAANVIQNHLAAGYGAGTAAARNEMFNKLADIIYADKNAWKDKLVIREKRRHRADVAFERKGKTLFLSPNDSNLRAVALMANLAKLDSEQLKGPMKLMRSLNNWIRWTAVSANPAFLIANTPRDYLTARYNLKANEAGDYAKEIGSLKAYKEAFKALYQVIIKDQRIPGDANTELVEDYEKHGGKTSFVQTLRPQDSQSWRGFANQVQKAHGKKRAIVEWGEKQLRSIEDLNITIENVMRLSTYKVMREKFQTDHGMSEEQAKAKAAELGRNLTTNFTRRGAHIDTINTWWLFYNATVQGNWQVIQNLFFNENKKGRNRLAKAVGGTILFSFILDQIGRAVDDDWDEAPEWEKERKIRTPLQIGGDNFSIPAPWVFNIFWRAGSLLSEVTDGVKKPDDALMDLIGLVTSSMDPVGGGKALTEEGTWLQAAAPTSFDWFAQIQENRNWMGNPLGPEGLATNNRPDAYSAWDSTPEGYKHAAQFVNELTGGNVAESGLIDLRPSTLRVLTEFLLGGVGRFGLDAAETLGLTGDENIFEREGPADVPGVKTFFVGPTDNTAVSLYHDRVAKVLSAERLVKDYKEGSHRDPLKLAEVQRDRAAELRMTSYVRDVERQIKALRKSVKSAMARDDSRTEKTLRDRITQLQRRFNESYARRVGN